MRCDAAMAQSVEHILGKDEVIGSIPISSSIIFPHKIPMEFCEDFFVHKHN